MKKNDLMEEGRKKFDLDKANNKIRNLEIGHIDRAYMIGYNDACEKALEWLREEFDDIFTITGKCFDVNSDEFFYEFQQALHPRSIEQINNCIMEE